MTSRPLLLLLTLLLAAPMVSPASALAEESEEEDKKETKEEEIPYDEMTPQQVRLQSVRLRKKVKALDRSDTAAAYGFALRREARMFVGGGLGVVGLTMGVSGLALAIAPNDKVVPLIASIGVPIGLGVVVAGLPAMILAPRFLNWYATNGPAPSHMARLKLMNRWRMEELRIRRDTALIATGFFGGATLLTMAVWAGRDRASANGVPGTNYDPGDAITALSFLGVTSGTGVTAILWSVEYRRSLMEKHRLFVMPTVSAGPEFAPQSFAQRIENEAPIVGLGVRANLTFTF
ncbi:MAG: hypothetical protein KDA24_17755 [Deltaproteobacteria bacterium]|nr:hypothetical protein [Deltaproteobacteria bacterium]